MAKLKRKTTRKRKKVGGSEDTRNRRKYKKGGRIEAYTFGEVGKGSKWPF